LNFLVLVSVEQTFITTTKPYLKHQISLVGKHYIFILLKGTKIFIFYVFHFENEIEV